MHKTQNDFNYSIKYAFDIRDSVENYSHRLRCLYSYITHDKFQNSKDFYKKYTAFKDTNLIKSQYDNEVVKNSEHDYRYYNLTRPFVKSAILEPKPGYKVINTLTFAFTSKQGMRNFIKDMRFTKDQIPYGFCRKVNGKPVFTFPIVFDKGLHINVANKIIEKIITQFLNRTDRYGKVHISTNINMPSSIYEHWIDPFTGKIITDLSKILCGDRIQDFEEKFSKISLKDLLFAVEPYIKQFNLHQRAKKSRSLDFISNREGIDKNFLRCNTYLVNHFMMQKNPYIRAQARKDWKFAAETFIAEVFGKYKYRCNKHNEKYSERVLKDEFDRTSDVADTIRIKEDCVISHQNSIKFYEKEIEKNKELIIKYPDSIKKFNSDIKNHQDAIDREKMKLGWSLEDLEKLKVRYNEELKTYLANKKEECENTKEEALGLQFSKAEIKSFIRSLNLKTKIDCNKFRKKVLDTLLELKILSTDFRYQIKLTCRTYKLDFQWIKKLYKEFLKKIDFYFNIILYLNTYIMLENVLFVEKVKNKMRVNSRKLLERRLSAPPLYSEEDSNISPTILQF